jgi:hypothetical protein
VSYPISTVLRVRSRVADVAIRDNLAGKILGAADYDVLLTGPTRVSKPDGSPLCVFLPGAVGVHSQNPDTYGLLHTMHTAITASTNRGLASGTPRFKRTDGGRSWARRTSSAIVGAVDPMGQRRYCRLTAWTGENLTQWRALQPLLMQVADHLADQVPDRYRVQAQIAAQADPAWVVPGTPFSTVTVNNTYPTGVHTDKGDLEEGFSTIACLRRGTYTGGQLVFPAYRVAVDMHDGDLLLMDAHEWHGNTAIVCACGTELAGLCPTCAAERISVVSYFRTKIAQCGSPEEEYERASAQREKALYFPTDTPVTPTPPSANINANP